MKSVATMAVALGLATLGAVPARAQQVWTAQYPLPNGGRVSVENVQGEIVVEGWDRPEVQVLVTKTVRGGDASRLDDVRIVVERGENSLAFHTVYPEGLDEPIRVDYRLKVPRQARLDALSTLEGNVLVANVEGVVAARCLNGNIRGVNVAGELAARTINGSIVASLRSLPEAPGALHLDTVSGDIHLILPAHPNADLELSTVAGRIASGYALKVSSKPGDTIRRTRLGRGGTRVALRTVRGNIQVEEGSDVL